MEETPDEYNIKDDKAVDLNFNFKDLKKKSCCPK
jgi:hypothetical protein